MFGSAWSCVVKKGKHSKPAKLILISHNVCYFGYYDGDGKNISAM